MVVGIDEVGRGCWAGPLVAGAVLLGYPFDGLKDSKKLSRQQREKLAPLIQSQAAAWGLGWASPQEIDQIGLTVAVQLAMERALARIDKDYDEIIIDGSYNFLSADPRAKTLIKADDTVPAVSAASIIAKVARDAYMTQQASKDAYRMYAFDKHVGYGTALHRAMLERYGICDLHRRSYKPVQAFCYNT